MKTKLLLMLIFGWLAISLQGQTQKCNTMMVWNELKINDPEAAYRMQQLEVQTQDWIKLHKNYKSGAALTIPVVVHVVYNNEIENISDEQIQSQIDVLNADFRLLNTDSLDDSHPFWYYTADTEIEFCLAKQDENGNATTGITRTHTDSLSFSSDAIKFTDQGGKDNWDPTKYLNIWVCNIVQSAEGSTLGYATFPSDLSVDPDWDGVVIRHQAFGTVGTAGSEGFTTNNLGRTTTHEVGHWLNLFHIWGDDECGDDMVEDTPPQEGENYDCPTFPHRPNNICGSDENGEMYMNYMDYVDDNCMNMFTFGQGLRMWAAIESARSGLKTSQGCTATGIENVPGKNLYAQVFPNPSNGDITISFNSKMKVYEIILVNPLGQVVTDIKNQTIQNGQLNVSLDYLSDGIYYLLINSEKGNLTQKIILNR